MEVATVYKGRKPPPSVLGGDYGLQHAASANKENVCLPDIPPEVSSLIY